MSAVQLLQEPRKDKRTQSNFNFGEKCLKVSIIPHIFITTFRIRRMQSFTR